MTTVPARQPFCKASGGKGYKILYSTQVAFPTRAQIPEAFQTLEGWGWDGVWLQINKGLLNKIYFSCNHNMESNINKLKIL